MTGTSVPGTSMTERPGPHPVFSGGPDGGGSVLTCVVPADAAGDRLDKVLAAALADLSRSRLRALLDQGCVQSAGRTITDPSQRVKPGQTFDVHVPDPVPAQPEPQALPLTILYEDEDVLVVDKPPGLVVHPAPGNRDRTLVNALLAHCGDSLAGIGGVCRPGIVHRLDKDTSGLLVVAKSERAHAGLSSQFGDRTISRTYTAAVWGLPAPRAGEISGNIGRSPADRKKMAVVDGGGKPALTRYRVIRGFGAVAALVECRLETGRTHQIRVHLASIGHPLLGDPLYGRTRTAARLRLVPPAIQAPLFGFPRQALHAWRLEFRHPTTGQTVAFETAMPEDMKQLMDCLEQI
jgi:23S rRNA pseudouridine1911/1915/1917 synthase